MGPTLGSRRTYIAKPMSSRRPAGVTLSVVMPAYNEEASIGAAIQEVVDSCLDAVPGSELVVVDDGSRDATARIVAEIAGRDPRVRLLSQRNGGHGAAVVAGISEAAGAWLFLVDSDQQIPLDGFAAAWNRRERLDAVLGRRVQRKESAVRRVVTTSLRGLIRLLLGAPLRDANAPYKLLRRSVWEDCRRFIAADCLIPSVFLAVCIHRHGWRYETVPVAHRPRAGGEGSLPGLKLARFCARAAVQLLALSARLAVIRAKLPEPEPVAEVS